MKELVSEMETEAHLRRWRGARAQIWMYHVSLRRLAIRLRSDSEAQVLYLVALGCERVRGPFRWERAAIDVVDRSENRAMVRDQGAGFELVCDSVTIARGPHDEVDASFDNFLGVAPETGSTTPTESTRTSLISTSRYKRGCAEYLFEALGAPHGSPRSLSQVEAAMHGYETACAQLGLSDPDLSFNRDFASWLRRQHGTSGTSGWARSLSSLLRRDRARSPVRGAARESAGQFRPPSSMGPNNSRESEAGRGEHDRDALIDRLVRGFLENW